MKQYAYITDPERFLRDHELDYDMSVNITSSDGMEDHGWILVREFDLDLGQVDVDMIRRKALELIEKEQQKEVAEHEVKMQIFEERRQNLLAIAHQPTEAPPVLNVIATASDGFPYED